MDHRLSENRGSGRSVSRDVAGAACRLFRELCAEVDEAVLDLDLFGDGHAVVRDDRSPEPSAEGDVATLGTESSPHRVRNDVDSNLERLARILVK